MLPREQYSVWLSEASFPVLFLGNEIESGALAEGKGQKIWPGGIQQSSRNELLQAGGRRAAFQAGEGRFMHWSRPAVVWARLRSRAVYFLCSDSLTHPTLHS